MLIFSVSSCAANSNASFTLSKAHSGAFIFFLKVSLYSSHVPLFEAVKPFSSLVHCNLCHGSIALPPRSLWLAIPAATDLVFLPAFVRQPTAETSLPLIFHKRNVPTSHADIYGSFPIIVHILPRYACSASSQLRPTKCSPPVEKLLQFGHRNHIVDTSLSSGWRDDTPQEICALQHNSLYDVRASRFIFCHFFKGFAYSFEGPNPHLIVLGVQSVSALFSCSSNSLAGDPCCRWPCVPSSFFLSQHPLEISSLSLFQFLVQAGLLPTFFIAFFSSTAFHCQDFNGAKPCAVNLS